MEELFRSMAKRGRQANLSFFAFTATPKHKTLAVFGRDGKPAHRYTMRQAIEEGFILDVLKNYTTYATYFRLLESVRGRSERRAQERRRALGAFHEAAPAQHRPEDGSDGRAFPGCHPAQDRRAGQGDGGHRFAPGGSPLQAELRPIYQGEGIRDQVAGGVLRDGGGRQDCRMSTYTEEGMNNGIREKELPEKFATQEYQVLLVAEKYQTGFDQPLLHTMYVDKRLAGIQAVQTLSRLNRIHPLKEDTFVLDFVNDREEIREAFKTYYEGAEMGEEVDPPRMYEIKGELDAAGIYMSLEVERFCEIYFKPKQRQSAGDHKLMNAALDPAVDRFKALRETKEEEAELWRGKLQAFRNLYAFLSQIIPYQDSDLERLYVFLRHLSSKLPRRRRARFISSTTKCGSNTIGCRRSAKARSA